MQDKSAAIIVAIGARCDKLWTPIAGRLILARTVDVFEHSSLIETIVLVTSVECLVDATNLCKREHWQKVVTVVTGGVRRQDSVRKGLDTLANLSPDCRWVIIHDGARPFVTPAMLEAGLQAAQEHQAAIAAVPVKETIKQVSQGQISTTLDRSLLWTVQTPQVFSFPLIYQAHHFPFAQEDVINDITLLKRMGQQVTIFPGSYTNIRITTQEDLLLAETLIQGYIP